VQAIPRAPGAVGQHERVTAPGSAAIAPTDEAPDPVDPVIDPRLARWEKAMTPVIVLAALVPIVVAFAPRYKSDPFVILNIVSWLVFVADLLVHMRWRKGYLRTGLGRFDLAIVVFTFPWYLLPSMSDNIAVLSIARLGRLARLIMAGGMTNMVRRLVERIGKAGLYSIGLILICSEVVYRVEPPSSGFDTQGEAIWWGFVTFTTVGYGDLVPETPQGRTVSVILMLGGVALIGLLAGSLAEFLAESDDTDEELDAIDDADLTDSERSRVLLDEVRSLREELADLRTALGVGAEAPPGSPGGASDPVAPADG